MSASLRLGRRLIGDVARRHQGAPMPRCLRRIGDIRGATQPERMCPAASGSFECEVGDRLRPGVGCVYSLASLEP